MIMDFLKKLKLTSDDSRKPVDEPPFYKEVIFKGDELIGLEYEPAFDYFTERTGKKVLNSHKILDGEFVTTEDGTGVVHIAPGFGEDDFNLCKKNNIAVVCPVDDGGCFNIDKNNDDIKYKLGEREEILHLNGRQVFETNDDIIKYLKSKDLWVKTEQYLHNYPHCWRTDTPLIYKAVSSWYVNVVDQVLKNNKGEKESIKDRMCELNKQINWIPNHIRDGQFGKWLENARDWSITRNRFWGAPVPVWRIKNDNSTAKVFGSIKELEEFFKEDYIADFKAGKNSGQYIQDKNNPDNSFKITDLHRPYVDELIKHTENGDLKRVEDVLDCWFESGSMPYAQVHYPFEYRDGNNNLIRTNEDNKKWFDSHFPCDFVTEYVAQTRGWFYTMVVLASALFRKIPFRNVICHGVMLDANGQKLSKRLRNYPDPLEMIDVYGSDAMRWLMASSPVVQGGDMRIDKDGKMIADVVKNVLNPIWNAFIFYKQYAELDKIKITGNLNSENVMDKYILSKLKLFVEKIEKAMDTYNTILACHEVELFIDVLNNWYIRRNKERFWKKEHDNDKQQAYETLHCVLKNFSTAISPILPFLTEHIFIELRNFE